MLVFPQYGNPHDLRYTRRRAHDASGEGRYCYGVVGLAFTLLIEAMTHDAVGISITRTIQTLDKVPREGGEGEGKGRGKGEREREKGEGEGRVRRRREREYI